MSKFLSLIDFWKIQRTKRGETTIIRPFHHRIADALTKIILGRQTKPNLMILMPSRMAKTELTSKTFPAWALSYFPDSEFLLASYGADEAEENTSYIRTTLSSDWYRKIKRSDFGATVEMRGGKAAGRNDRFKTLEGGTVRGFGLTGPTLGKGCGKLRPEFGGAGIVDDPLKIDDVRSPVVRQKCIDNFLSAVESRRNRKKTPMTPLILVMQRLHPDDLAGFLLKTQRERWEVIQIPAIDEKGESIWPERISLEELEHIKESNPDEYWAVYMQQPQQDETRKLIKKRWFKYWKDRIEVEKRLTFKIITADTAFKDKDSADFTVLQCWGFENTSAAYLMDQERGKWEFPELLANSRAFIAKHRTRERFVTPATEFWVEDKASGISLAQTMRREGIGAKAWEPNDKTAKDKVGRVNQCTMPLSVGRVYIPDPTLPGMHWVGRNFLPEMGAFSSDDSHLYDDQVDGMTTALLIWQQRGGGVGPLPIWP